MDRLTSNPQHQWADEKTRLLSGMDQPNDSKTTSLTEGIDTQNATSETASLVEKQRRVDANKAEKLRIAVLVVSYISVICLFLLGLVTLGFAIVTNNSAGIAFTLDAWLDCLSSIVVIWRFSSKNQLYSPQRERISALILGTLFIISSIVIVTKSSIGITNMQSPHSSEVLLGLSIFNGVFCLALAIAKVYLGKMLESLSIITDAVNSIIGCVVAFSTVISDVIFSENPDIWYVDATVAIICAFFLFVYGAWLIIFELKVHTGDCKLCSRQEEEQPLSHYQSTEPPNVQKESKE